MHPVRRGDDPVEELSQRLLQCTDRVTSFTLGENPEFVTPGLKGQFTQELILGAEYEFVPDLKFGLNYILRKPLPG